MSDASEPKQAESKGVVQDGRPASAHEQEVKKAEGSSTESEKCETHEE